jgi:hypothetical protein
MQTTLKLPAQLRRIRPVLVDVNSVMQMLCVSAESVYELVDGGDLRWVWNVSEKPDGTRLLRFWVGELMPSHRPACSLPEAIAAVIGHPHETNLSRRTAGDILLLRSPSIKSLVDGGELLPPTQFDTGHITRASLVEFLTRRLVS